jgi:hypothetical protein
MVQRVVGMADVPPSFRLLKKLSSRRDCSTYRLVRLAVQSPCGLADDLFEKPVIAYAKASYG